MFSGVRIANHSIAMQNHLAFHRFQPICDRIMRDRSSKDVDTLYGMVKDAESFYLQNIQQFLLVPLITRMGETSGTRWVIIII